MHTRPLHRLRAATATVGLAVLLLGASCLASGPAQAAAEGAAPDKAPRSKPYTRVLVVGVSPEVSQRCPFERFLAAQIQSASVTALPSCDVVAQKNPLTRESIEAAIASQQADAVVTTALVAMAMKSKEGGSRDTRGHGLYKATDTGFAYGYYGMYGVPVVYGEFQAAPALMEVKGAVEVVSRVYETGAQTMVYEVTTKAKDLGTRESALVELTGKIAKRLRKEGLIR